ncbi:hypothetical protein [Vibrio harveyi]|uniref:Uncharacterized protein n=1 Tax=Vibrio harveyi TaxID=669 RepID=A0A8B3DE35_VIBHA|nr:hypothetical protein [Vibrio harveyi]EKO3858716.1 hypothetical protein [Vibrio harveyi]RIW05311.1 hypothetical protein DS957_022845 [Vibrio harveyi]
MNLKRTIGIAVFIVAMPFLNATGGDFTVYSPATSRRLETHLQFAHGFYSSLQFMPNDMIRYSHGLYAVVDNTVFMLSLKKSYEFLDNKHNAAKTIEINARDYLSQINVAQFDAQHNTVYLNKRFEYERLDNIQVSGKLGFW